MYRSTGTPHIGLMEETEVNEKLWGELVTFGFWPLMLRCVGWEQKEVDINNYITQYSIWVRNSHYV